MTDELLGAGIDELYEQAPCGYIFTRPTGQFARVNATFLQWTGYQATDLVDKVRFQDLLTVPGKIFYENQYAPLLVMQGAVREVAFDLVRPDGSLLPTLVNSMQRVDQLGRPTFIASTIFDATERRRYEQELLLLRRRAEQLSAVVDAAHDPILTLSATGLVQGYNHGARRLLAEPPEGLRLDQFVTFAGGAGAFEAVWSQVRGGRPVQREGVVAWRDRAPIDVSVSLSPHLSDLGELLAVACVIRDISDRMLLEHAQNDFLAMATHELRNPLTVLKGHVQLVRRRGEYNEASLNALSAALEQLEVLIEDLHLVNLIEAERLELTFGVVDLVAEAQAAAAGMSLDSHDLFVQAASESLPVRADGVRLRQVIINLVSNAIKYSPPGTPIVVSVRQEDGEAALTVTDQGSGIPEEEIPRLFERFYRARALTGDAQGLGLGLFISRRIVEAHGGRITVSSAVGRGSSFTVVLPIGERGPLVGAS